MYASWERTSCSCLYRILREGTQGFTLESEGSDGHSLFQQTRPVPRPAFLVTTSPPHPPHEAEPVAVEDVFDVRLCVAAVGEQAGHLLDVGDGIEISWALFGAVATIEIGPDRCVIGVASDLTDVVDVIDNIGETGN
jgi:hypothetical protein